MRNAETIVGWVILADDRTDFYNWQEAGHRAERLAITASMVGSLAHELRNPLSAAKGLLQLSGRKRDPEKASYYNDLILRELDRVTRLLNEFLLLGRVGNQNEEVLNPGAVISELFPILEGETIGTSVEIIIKLSEVPRIYFDQGQLTQVLLNLIRNAVEATGSQGQVTIMLRQEGEQVLLEVQDEGPGISTAIREKLFQPFFTTKERGTGLGLAVTQAIIHSHGGEISVRNAESGGAIFSVLIPAYNVSYISSIDVMIVSDDELVRYPVERMLSKACLTTVTYSTPEEAFSLGNNINPAVLILTISSIQVVQNIKMYWPKVKIIIVCSPDNMINLPNVVYMYKPLNYGQLISCIKFAVEKAERLDF